MQEILTRYLNYLLIERGMASNTIEAYGRDLRRYFQFLLQKDITQLSDVKPEVIIEYLVQIRGEGLSANSMNRALAALRGLYKYLIQDKIINE